MQLAIGTAQFGQKYGVTNRTGAPTAETVHAILSFSLSQGVTMIDTAPAYGESEAILGQALRGREVEMVTKLPSISTLGSVEAAKACFEKSTQSLERHLLHGLLVHEPQDLQSKDWGMVRDWLCELKDDGDIERCGVSVTHPEQLESILGDDLFDLIQVPLNVADHRFLPHLPELKRNGFEIHIRSAFLQGVLLEEPSQLNSYFSPVKPQLQQWHHWLNQQSWTPLSGCFNFLSGIKEIDYAIVGVNSLEQLKEIFQSFTNREELDLENFQPFQLQQETFFNPSSWKIEA